MGEKKQGQKHIAKYRDKTCMVVVISFIKNSGNTCHLKY